MNPMRRMSTHFWAISSWSTVDEAAEWMDSVGVSELLVSDGYVLKGVLTSSQIAAHRNSSCPKNDSTFVRSIMNKRVPCCNGLESKSELLSKLEMSPVGLLLVLDEDRNVIGVIRKNRQDTPWCVAASPLLEERGEHTKFRTRNRWTRELTIASRLSDSREAAGDDR